MDLRTGPGRFKKVMLYEYGSTFGNDLGDSQRANRLYWKWEEVFVAHFVEFFGPLFQG